MDRVYHYDMPALAGEASEIQIQKACRARIAAQFPRTAIAAIPNGSKRTRWQQVQAKLEGLSKGFPDLIVIGPGKVAFVEIKARSALSQEQHDWLDLMHRYGFPCGVFRSQDTLAAKLREWGFS